MTVKTIIPFTGSILWNHWEGSQNEVDYNQLILFWYDTQETE